MADETSLTDVEEKFRATKDWRGRTYQQYSLDHEVNLAPIDDVRDCTAASPNADGERDRTKPIGLKPNIC